MKLFLIRYDLDEAMFLVSGTNMEQAVQTWLKDRRKAGCGMLELRLINVVEQVFQGKVSQLREI